MEKNKRRNYGITLVALVITIVILLILAGISIATLNGKNGLLIRTKEANEKTIISQYEEELNLCIIQMQVDYQKDGKELTLKDIYNNFETFVKNEQNTDDIYMYEVANIDQVSEITGIYKGYDFKIEGKFKAKILYKSTESNVTVEIINPITESGYINTSENIRVIIRNANGIKQIKKEDGSVINGDGKKEIFIEYNGVEKNTSYNYEIENMDGKKDNKTAKVTNIDKLAPKEFVVEYKSTNEYLEITANTEDADSDNENANSGIERYEYYVRGTGESGYTKYDTNKISKKKGEYSVYAIAYDNAGNSTIGGCKIDGYIKLTHKAYIDSKISQASLYANNKFQYTVATRIKINRAEQQQINHMGIFGNHGGTPLTGFAAQFNGTTNLFNGDIDFTSYYDKWIDYVQTYDNNSVKMYINGVLKSQVSLINHKPCTQYGNGTIYIGDSIYSHDGRMMSGKMMSFKVWNVPLNDSEVKSLKVDVNKSNIKSSNILKELSFGNSEDLNMYCSIVGSGYSFLKNTQ